MIYVKQTYNLEPAAPATRDRFVEVVQERLLPKNAQLGARLVGAFFAHDEWYSQIIHVTEFDGFDAFGHDRAASIDDSNHLAVQEELAELAPQQDVQFLEPLGAVETSKLHDAIESSAVEANDTYTFAILEVESGKMGRFGQMLSVAQKSLPILACWRDVSGNPNRIIDLWKGDIGETGFRPSNAAQNAFFEPLRELAPREKLMRLHAMPYSPLR